MYGRFVDSPWPRSSRRSAVIHGAPVGFALLFRARRPSWGAADRHPDPPPRANSRSSSDPACAPQCSGAPPVPAIRASCRLIALGSSASRTVNLRASSGSRRRSISILAENPSHPNHGHSNHAPIHFLFPRSQATYGVTRGATTSAFLPYTLFHVEQTLILDT